MGCDSPPNFGQYTIQVTHYNPRINPVVGFEHCSIKLLPPGLEGGYLQQTSGIVLWIPSECALMERCQVVQRCHRGHGVDPMPFLPIPNGSMSPEMGSMNLIYTHGSTGAYWGWPAWPGSDPTVPLHDAKAGANQSPILPRVYTATCWPRQASVFVRLDHGETVEKSQPHGFAWKKTF